MKNSAYKVALNFMGFTEVNPKKDDSVDPKKLEEQARETLKSSYPVYITSLQRKLGFSDLLLASDIMLKKLNSLSNSTEPEKLFATEMSSQRNKVLSLLKDISFNEDILMKNFKEYIKKNPDIDEDDITFYVDNVLKDIRKSTNLFLNRINNIIH
jgi:hypothetical protein